MNRLLVASLLLLGVSALFVPSGHADIVGDCDATLNGVPIAGRSGRDMGDAFPVQKNGTVNLSISADRPVRAFQIELEYGFSRFTLHEESFPVGVAVQNRTGSFDVAEFAQYGSGAYRVVTSVQMSDGSTCTITALLDVDGNPLTTVAGIVALGGAALGLAGLIQAIVGGYQQVKEVKDSIEDFRASARAVRDATDDGRF